MQCVPSCVSSVVENSTKSPAALVATDGAHVDPEVAQLGFPVIVSQ